MSNATKEQALEAIRILAGTCGIAKIRTENKKIIMQYVSRADEEAAKVMKALEDLLTLYLDLKLVVEKIKFPLPENVMTAYNTKTRRS